MTNVVSVNSVTSDGSYKAGGTVTVSVAFSTAVDVDTTGGIPTLTLDVGRAAAYLAGSGTSTLTFAYTVAAGDNSADLDYASTSALALNGGTILESGTGIVASLILPSPGAAGSLGANASVIIDTVAPTTTIATVAFSADTGAFGSDFITNTAAQTLSGALSANLAAGEAVQVSTDNGASWNTATATVGTNTWSYGATLTHSDTLQVRVVDAAGNAGAAHSQLYVLDTTAPTTSVATAAFSADTGTSASDFITNAAAQTISGSLSANLAAGEEVQVSANNGVTWYIASATVGANTWSVQNVLLASSDTLKVRIADAAGNVGATYAQAYVLDTTAPTTTVATAAISADTGTSASDFITNAAAQTISGTLSANLAAGETVQVSTDNGASWRTASATVGANTWTDVATFTQSDTLQVRVIDAAGNQSATYAQAYVYDTVAPAGGGSIGLSADTGASASDFITKTSAQTISGVLANPLAAGDTAAISTDNGATWQTITPVANAFSHAATLAGSDVVQVRVTDAAGNASVVLSHSYVIDTAAPPAPSTPDLSAASDTGTSSTDNLTSDATPTFTGTSEANAAISLFDTDGTTVLGTTTADGSGHWSITSSALAIGQHTVSVEATDLAGNTSAASAGLTLTIQSVPPPAQPPVVAVMTPTGSQLTGDATSNVISWSGAGADTVLGGAGDDTVIGGLNNDVLQGNTGDDRISAGLGADVVHGGQGDDFVNGNQGDDQIFGDLGNDTVAGGQGDDFVRGNQGDDVVLGDLGDDVLLGGQGNDVIGGGDGADHLSGDLGDDTLTGGAGADTFNFIGGAGRDVVTDFSHADGDHILLPVTQAADFQALSSKMAMVGADTVLTLERQTIVLTGVSMSSLTAGDFLFS